MIRMILKLTATKKWFATTITSALLVGLAGWGAPAFSQDETSISPPDSTKVTGGQEGTSSDQPTPYPQPEISPGAVEKAYQLLVKSAKAYQRAQKLRDVVTLSSPDPITGEPSEQKLTLEFYGGTDALVDLGEAGYRFFSVGTNVYVTRAVVPLQYFETDLKGDLANTVADKSGPGIIFPHFALRRSSDPKLLEEAVTRTLQNGKITGYHRAVIDGEDIHEIYAEGSNGDLYIAIDPETYFLKSLTVQLDPIPDPDPAKSFDGAVIVFSFAPQVLEELTPPDPSIFKSADYARKAAISQLDYDPITIGDRFPRITVKTVDGDPFRYCDDLSKINIMIYFVMDDEMSSDTMHMAQELEQRIKDENLPVNIVAVDTLEDMDDAQDEWRGLLKNYLGDNAYDFTTVMDVGSMSTNNHNIGYIPTLIMVDRHDMIRRKYDRKQALGVDKMIADIKRLLKEDEEKATADSTTTEGAGN